MRRLVWSLVGAFTAAALALAAGCGPKRIPGTQILDTPDTQAILKVIAQYKDGYEKRDAAEVLAVVSKRFYETNGTPDPSDDYNYDGLAKNLAAELAKVSHPVLDLDIRRIDVQGDKATVNYYYTARYQIADAGTEEGFRQSADVAQIHLERQDGQWKIVSGI